MRKTNFTYLIFIFLLLISCNDQILLDNSLEGINDYPKAVFDSESDKEAIVRLGFDVNDIINNKDHYVVEGDIMLGKKDLTAESQTLLRQARSEELINYYNQNNITVGISSSLLTSGVDSWYTEIQKAINNWNNITGCRIHMTYTTSANPDINISIDNGMTGHVVANASFPANGKPGSTIRVNFNYAKQRELTSSEKEYHMTHELGHCLGLRHTNWTDRGEIPAGIKIPGTPDADDNSVMYGGIIKRSWMGFTKYDLIAIRFMYPEKKHELKFRNSSPLQAGFNNSIYLANPISDVNYTLTIDGADVIGSNGTIITDNASNRPISDYQEVMFHLPSNMNGRTSIYFYLYMNGDLAEMKTVPVSR